MKVDDLSKLDKFTILTVTDGEREIDGCYIGDLLSWVMGKAQSGNVWITIMSNINIVAVASLADVSCIVLAEGVSLDQTVIESAQSRNINIISTDLSAYEAAIAIGKYI